MTIDPVPLYPLHEARDRPIDDIGGKLSGKPAELLMSMDDAESDLGLSGLALGSDRAGHPVEVCSISGAC